MYMNKYLDILYSIIYISFNKYNGGKLSRADHLFNLTQKVSKMYSWLLVYTIYSMTAVITHIYYDILRLLRTRVQQLKIQYNITIVL